MSTHSGPREWDAEAYDRVSDLQLAWGREVLDRLPLEGDETVLDASCGTGRVTEVLLERVPRGRVLAVDASAEMVARTHTRLAGRAEVRQEAAAHDAPLGEDAPTCRWGKMHGGDAGRTRRSDLRDKG